MKQASFFNLGNVRTFAALNYQYFQEPKHCLTASSTTKQTIQFFFLKYKRSKENLVDISIFSVSL
jgi:hypothetical protein